jgi:hypothetical protein
VLPVTNNLIEMFYTKTYKWNRAEAKDMIEQFGLYYGNSWQKSLLSWTHERIATLEALDYMWDRPELIDWHFINTHKKPNPSMAALFDKYGKQNWIYLSSNPAAASYLSTHLDELDWTFFSENPSDIALDILENYPEKINYRHLCLNTNPRAMAILRNHISEIDWDKLSVNTSDAAVALLKEHPDKIQWDLLSYNKNPEAVKMLYENIPKIYMDALGHNVGAISMLRDHLEVVSWYDICRDAETPEAFQFIEENIHRLSTSAKLSLKLNAKAKFLVDKYPNIRDIRSLYLRYTAEMEEVFKMYEIEYVYDYNAILKAKYDIHQDYHAWVGHPSRINKWKDWKINECLYQYDDDNDVDDAVNNASTF